MNGIAETVCEDAVAVRLVESLGYQGRLVNLGSVSFDFEVLEVELSPELRRCLDMSLCS